MEKPSECRAPSSYLTQYFEFPAEPVTYRDYLIYKEQAKAIIKQCNARFDSINMEYKDGRGRK